MRIIVIVLTVLMLSSCYIRIGGEEYVVSTVRYGEGAVSPASASVLEGNRAVFVVTPASGWELQRVEGCNGELVGLEYTTDRIRANCTVRVWFEQSTNVTLTIFYADSSDTLIQVTLPNSSP